MNIMQQQSLLCTFITVKSIGFVTCSHAREFVLLLKIQMASRMACRGSLPTDSAAVSTSRLFKTSSMMLDT